MRWVPGAPGTRKTSCYDRDVRLDSTFRDARIHQEWQAVYRSDPAQAAFDDAVYDWLFRKLTPDRLWLDAGCGTGHHAFRLAEHGCEVTAVDISETALETARRAAASHPHGNRVRFQCCPLEQLDGAIREAGNVHCRGVLMHIPEWRAALGNLCGYVKPGGYLVLFESNAASLEALFVRLARRFIAVKSALRKTDAGLEFWTEAQGNPFLARMFDIQAIVAELAARGVALSLRRSLFLLDPNRVPARLRTPLRWLNRFWFTCNGPFASGVILVFRRSSGSR